MQPPSNAQDSRTLLISALKDPLGITSGAVGEWLGLLTRDFPLWSFQAWAYAPFRMTVLPSNYPLQLLINSIVRDDGMTPRDRTKKPLLVEGEPFPVYEESKELSGVEYAIDRRRDNLMGAGRFGPEGRQRTETLPLKPGHSQFNIIYPLPYEPEDYENFPTIVSPEWELISKLTALLEQREAAPTEQEYAEANAKLQTFLSNISPSPGRGRPGLGPRLDEGVTRALIDQGAALLGLCADAFRLTLNQPLPRKTITALEANGIGYAETKEWAARLALPVLSGYEIRKLLGLFRRGSTLTPREVGICLLARRLGLRADTFAGRVTGGGVRERLASFDPFRDP